MLKIPRSTVLIIERPSRDLSTVVTTLSSSFDELRLVPDFDFGTSESSTRSWTPRGARAGP